MVAFCRRHTRYQGEDSVRMGSSQSAGRVRVDALILKAWVGGSLR